MTVLDVSGIDFGRTKEISEVRGMSLKFNLDVRWQSQGVIYAVRPLNGSPDTNSNTEWQTVQIQISWLLQKPTDLDLHCLQRQGISGFSRARVKNFLFLHKKTYVVGTH